MSLDDICEIFKMYYLNVKISSFDLNLAAIVTIDHILGKDIKKDTRRYYYLRELLKAEDWIIHNEYPVEYVMASLECNKFFRFISIFTRLFLDD